MYTKKMAEQNRKMLARALEILDPDDDRPLNHRDDKEWVLATMTNEFPEIPRHRRERRIVRAINRLRANILKRGEQ